MAPHPGQTVYCKVSKNKMRLKKRRSFYIINIYISLSLSLSLSLIYTPLPNSRWLHHTALRCVRREQLGAYMWGKGLKSIKRGSKWAQNTCSCTPNGRGSLLEKRVFDSFFTHFCSQNGPFSRHFGIFQGQNLSQWAQNGLKTLVGASEMVQNHFWKNAFLTHF